MKYALLALATLPLLSACQIETLDDSYFEPSAPHVHVSHLHERRNETYNNRHEHARTQSRAVVRTEPARTQPARIPEVRVEAPGNVHAHNPAPRVELERKARVYKKPGVVVEGQDNVHGHPAKPDLRIEGQNNVHGHD